MPFIEHVTHEFVVLVQRHGMMFWTGMVVVKKKEFIFVESASSSS